MPESVEMPAPVSTVIRRAALGEPRRARSKVSHSAVTASRLEASG